MAFCGKCGQQVNDGVKFCPACGAPTGCRRYLLEPEQHGRQHGPVRSQRHRTAQRHVDPGLFRPAGSYSDIGGQRLAFCPISFQPGFAALHRMYHIWYSVQHSERRDPRYLMVTLFCGEHHRSYRFRICRAGRDRNSQCRERSSQRAPAYRKIPLIKIVFISNNLLL